MNKGYQPKPQDPRATAYRCFTKNTTRNAYIRVSLVMLLRWLARSPRIEAAASQLSSNPGRSGPRTNNQVAPLTNSAAGSSAMKEPLLNRTRPPLEKVWAVRATIV